MNPFFQDNITFDEIPGLPATVIDGAEDLLKSQIPSPEPGYIEGNSGIMVSVPHCVRHYRNGNVKESEINTFAIALVLHSITGCHIIFNRDFDCDPNYDEGGRYKEKLADIVRSRDISMIIDLHGAAPFRSFDFELGTSHGKNLNGNSFPIDLFRLIVRRFDFVLTVDTVFPASNPNTISSSMFAATGIPAIQIEINKLGRDTMDMPRLRKTVTCLAQFIGIMGRVGHRASEFIAAECGIAEIVLPHNRIELPDGLAGNWEEDENIEVIGVSGSEQCLVKGSSHSEFVRLGRRVYDDLTCDCNVIALKKSDYRHVKVYKPRIEAIDNSTVAFSSDVYEGLKGFDIVEVYNSVSGVRAYYPPKLYTSNINGRCGAVWLSYLQRRLLNLELPTSLTPQIVSRLKKAADEESYNEFVDHYAADAEGQLRLGKIDEKTHNELKRIYQLAFGFVKVRGIKKTDENTKRQPAILQRYIGNVSIRLRVVRCTPNDELQEAVLMTRDNINRLGLNDGDKVFMKSLGGSEFIRVRELHMEEYSKVVRFNNLDSEDDIQMIVCVPATFRFRLCIRDINECVEIQRDLAYLVRKNITEQLLAVIGLFIAIFSIPEFDSLLKLLTFVALIPIVLYSILIKERERI